MKTPSPALIISILALFVALSGTTYAAVKINGKNIKKGTIAGTALKKNSVTGTQINESKLAKVPSAARADSAATADNASALAGVSAAGFVKGASSVQSNQVTVADGDSQTLISVPGFVDVSVACSSGSLIAFTFVSRTTDLTYAVSRNLSGSTNMLAGTINVVDATVSASAATAQTLSGSIWKPSSGKIVSLSASSMFCKTTATVIVSG